MKVHEYQAKEILQRYGVAELFVIKAQIHAGGRGKGGGVKLARSIEEVEKVASEMLGMQLVTPQTGPI